MNAKTYLGRARWLHCQIKQLEDKIYEIDTEMKSAGAMRYDKILVQTSPDGDQLVNYISRIIDCERKLVKLHAEYYATYENVLRQIGEMEPDLFRQILYLRYIEGMSFLKIADTLGRSFDYVRSRHAAALKAFQKKFLDC